MWSLTLAAVGRLRGGPERALFDEYRRRLRWPLKVVEIDSRGGSAGARQRAETDGLLAAMTECPAVIALDERGKSLTSVQFADQLGRWRDDGMAGLGLIIGGADGLTDMVRTRADLLLAFGTLTWPHMLARVMLVEQLYRAQSILEGHPYHRA